VQLSPTANALATAKAVRAKMEELSRYFPAGVRYDIPYDTSLFVQISIEEVVKTLLQAVVLVFLVMYLFLQNIRYTLIPTIVVPVALMGTFASMAAFGYSINVLTMFGMVLAIGILVDDAIVVVENVERIMSEEGLSPRDATRKAMGQITGAIVGITLVLTAVFIPMAFFGGAVGAIYRQFTLSMVSSMLFSALMALTLTPALCALILKPVVAGHHHEKTGFFGWFNRGFHRTALGYQSLIARMLLTTGRYMIHLWRDHRLRRAALLPAAFILLPIEDQGFLITNVQLPPGASASRTTAVLEQVEAYYLKEPSIARTIAVTGFSFSGSGQNAGLVFTPLIDWSKAPSRPVGQRDRQPCVRCVYANSRRDHLPDQPAADPRARQRDRLHLPPAGPRRPRPRGFAGGAQSAARHGGEKSGAGRHPPEGLEDTPQLQLDIDRDKANALGVTFADINNTLANALSSAYINDFPNMGRQQRVLLQVDAPQRLQPEDLQKLYVRNAQGTMVPFSSFAKSHWIVGAVQLSRYNGYPAVKISGDAAKGRSTGEAMDEMEKLAKQLPLGFGYEWTAGSYEEKMSGSQAPALFALSLLAVFLCLAALYESTSIPFR